MIYECIHAQHEITQRLHSQIHTPSSSFSLSLSLSHQTDGASLTQVAFLLSEASLLCGVSHINIHSPVAANTELSGPPQIAYPYPSKGNLKR